MNMLNNITRITLRIPDEIYNEIWEIHANTRKSINMIIVELIKKGLSK